MIAQNSTWAPTPGSSRPNLAGRPAPMLSGEELAVDKVLAVFGRAEARHFVDLAAVEPRYGLDRLFRLAAERRGRDRRAFRRRLRGRRGHACGTQTRPRPPRSGAQGPPLAAARQAASGLRPRVPAG